MENGSTSWSKKESKKIKGLIAQCLDPEFYARNTIEVAHDLLGKVLLVRNTNDQWTGGRIVETEAYRGDDPASHSSRGKTPRASVMFGSPGFAYVYFIYGMYEMLNFVTEPEGEPGAVLIRAIEPLVGVDLMRERRFKLGPSPKHNRFLTNGPGRLCRALQISLGHNRQSLAGPDLYVCEDGFKVTQVEATPRIGISKAKDRLWRFTISGNPYVSPVGRI